MTSVESIDIKYNDTVGLTMSIYLRLDNGLDYIWGPFLLTLPMAGENGVISHEPTEYGCAMLKEIMRVLELPDFWPSRFPVYNVNVVWGDNNTIDSMFIGDIKKIFSPIDLREKYNAPFGGTLLKVIDNGF